MTKEQKRNEKIANAILKFLIDNELGGDISIYFNGKAYRFTSTTEYKTMEDIKGSTFFEYANDDTVSMTFEGSFYYVMNGYAEEYRKLLDKFDKLINKHGMYCEQGHAWNLSLYEN